MQSFTEFIRVKHGIRILFLIGASICSLLGWFLFTPILYGHPANVKAHAITASGNSALAPGVPANPSDLIAKTVSQSKIDLAWTDNASNEEGFKIERKPSTAETYTFIATIGPNFEVFSDTGLVQNTKYFYRLRAYNTDGHSNYSDIVSGTTLPTSPKAPGNLTATAVSSTQINLAWQDKSDNEAGFKIERKIGDTGAYLQVAIVGANVTSYSSIILNTNTKYSYRVRVYNAGGQSDYSNEASATTFPNPPAAPSHLAATTVSNTRIDLAWQDNAINEDGFKLERKKGVAGTYVEIVPQGGIGANVQRFTDSSLVANTLYFYRLRAFNTGNHTDYSNETNATTLPDKPAAPGNLTATTASHTQINLTWQDNATNEDSFKIERKIGVAGKYVKFVTLGANVKNFSDEGLAANTEHFYRLRAANAGGQSDYSNEASTRTFPNPPAAPSNLTATTVSNTQINLAWQDNAINEEGFKIERKKGAADTYVQIAIVGANVKRFADSSLAANTLYFYRLRAFNTGNLTDYSNEASATTLPDKPTAPSHLTATTVSNTQINLTWQDNSINEDSFKIERKLGGSAGSPKYVKIAILGANVKSFSDNGLVANTEHFYRLRAANAGGQSDYSNEASATTLPDKPATPANLTATTASHAQINLAWQDNATNEDSFKIERKLGGSAGSPKYVKIATLGANVKSFSDKGLAANTEYSYRLRAANAGGHSDYSNEAGAKTFPNPPAAPSNLTATTVSNSRINLAWQDNAINEAGFKIERKKGVAGTYVEIVPQGGIGANVKRFADSSLVSSTLYFYRLRAFNTGNHTDYSNEANATTLPDKPAAPGNLTATTASHAQINLAWQDNATNEDSFKIERKIGAAGKYVKIATLGANVKNFSDKGLAANTEYSYRLRTANAGGQSDYSNEASATTFPNPPAAPSNLTATTVSNTRINLAWQDNAINEAGFKIERKKGVAGTYVEIVPQGGIGANVKRFADSSLVASTLYFYRLRAFNTGNLTDYSNEASATTLPDKPAAPSNLTATTVSHTQINLTWKDNAANEDSFKIERKIGAAGKYVKIAILGANVKSFSDKGLAASTEHFYRLRAANIGGQSDYSNEASATTFPNPPAAPSNLTATTVSNTRINLAWQDNAINEDGFKIERKKGVAGTYVEIVPQGGIGANVKRFADSSLVANTLYFYRLRAFNTGNLTGYANEASATTLPDKPAAPSHLTATTVSNTQINLTWQDNATNEDSFKIERKIGAAGNYVKFVTLGANVKSFSDKGLAVNTGHFYRLRAANAGGQSDYSNEARTTTFPNPPAAPSRLTATTISNTRINLAWQDNATNEDGFKIERKKGVAGTYVEIVPQGGIGAEVQRFADSSLVANTLYFYRLRAFNTGNLTDYSNEASATTLPDKPTAPSLLTATTVSNTQINLTWKDNATNEDSFKIERKIGTVGTYVKIATLGADVKSFSDKGLAANTEHFYRLRAANAGGQSDYSNEASATTLPNPPVTSEHLTATMVSHSQINLAWVDNSNNEVGFKIERKIGGVEAYAEVAKVGANVTSYSDHNLAGNTTYFYRIRAFNDGGHSDYSRQANATTLPKPPEAPGNLIATTVTFNRINLAWQDNSSNEAGFTIERKIGTEGKYEEIDSVAANATSYSNIGLNETVKYFYRVRAHNPGGQSGYSNVLEVTTLPFPPVTPGHLTTTSVSHNRINLTWADSSTNEAGFKIERRIGGVEAYAEVAKVGANVTSYSDNNLAGNTTYFYRLRAFNASGHSGYSNEVNATTLPRPPVTPGQLIATTVSSDRINLAWQDKSTNEDSFKIERKLGAAGMYKQIVALGVDTRKFSDAALAANAEYFYRIRAYNKGGFSDYSNAASATTLPVTPAAPRNLIATAVSSTRLNLAWADSANNEGGFEIERRLSTTKIYTKVATVEANVKSYSDNNLAANTAYFYRVRAFNAGGYSSYSNETSATTLPNPPATPGHLIATTVSNTQINLAWADSANNEIGFEIERKPGAAGTYAKIATLGANTKNFVDAALATNTQYFYRIRAYNPGGASAYSNEANATTLPNPPVTPGQLAATMVSSDRINLTWQDKSTNEDSFKIERKTGAAGKYAEVAKVGANVTSYSDNGLTENTTYFYRVRASNIGGPSNYSNEAGVTTPPTPPAAPANLTASTVSNTQIDLAWQDQSTNEDSFKIERKTPQSGAGTYKQIALLGANVKNFSDTGLAVNTGYFYRIRAYNPGGASAYSNEASAATLPNSPTSPDRLRAATISQGQINLAWSDSSNNEVGFKIERKTLEGIYTQIAAVNANVASYADRGLEQDTEYFYRVRAYNSGGHSGFSNEANAMTLPNAPATPGRLKATTKSSSRIDLAWADSSNNEAGFKIERKIPQSADTFAEIATVGANVTSYSSLSLIASTRYFYRVRAYNIGGHSAYSNAAEATTLPRPPAAPSDLIATPMPNLQIDLAWQDQSTNEDSFKIERKIGTAGKYVQITKVGQEVTSYSDTDSSLAANTGYFYRVRAFNAGGNSPYSNEVNATPSNNIHLALNKPALASSTEAASAADQAVDGNLTTFWRSGSVSTTAPLAWLRVELNASTAVIIDRAVIRWYQTFFAIEYEIQVSNNGTNWTKVYTNNAGAIGTQEATFPPTPARYVRLYMKRISKASYRVTEFEVYNGVTKASHNAASEVMIPETVALAQNYPNPFGSAAPSRFAGNPSTTISYALPKGLHVTLKVINLAGQEVATLANGYQDRGIYRVTFNARKLPSGVYYAVLQAGEVTQVQRMVLAK